METFFGLTKIYIYFKNIVEENIRQEFRLKNIDETRNKLINKKHIKGLHESKSC